MLKNIHVRVCYDRVDVKTPPPPLPPLPQVSLDSRVREVINRNMLDPTSHTFEDAQKQIYTLMQRDSYPRFMNSSAYTDLIKDLEEPKTEP